jgi:hypothetical protein
MLVLPPFFALPASVCHARISRSFSRASLSFPYFSVIPAFFRHSCLFPSFLPFSVIPAQAGIHLGI